MADLLEFKKLDLCISGKAILKGVTFSLGEKGTLGLVGESGSGKSMSALALMDLLPRGGRVDGGEIIFDGKALSGMESESRRKLRGGAISMVFQDPSSCLNPVMRVGDQVAEALVLHQGMDQASALAEAERWLDKTGIANAAARSRQYPHQFSGGMRQRVMIAMAMACRPKLLIADEPTTALDVTVQAQILKLLKALTAEYGVSLLMISHDLGVIHSMADRVVVMKGGEVMENGERDQIFGDPQNEYTKELMRSYLSWAGAA